MSLSKPTLSRLNVSTQAPRLAEELLKALNYQLLVARLEVYGVDDKVVTASPVPYPYLRVALTHLLQQCIGLCYT